LLRLQLSHQVAVLEAGTNHPGELAPLIAMIAPRLGVLTNIGREHLQFFGDISGVAREEAALAELLPASGVLFVPGADPWIESILKRSRTRVVRVGWGPENDFVARDIRYAQTGTTFSLTAPQAHLNGRYQIPLLGRHHVLNALLAIAAGAEFQLSAEQIRHGLAVCPTPKMRMQLFTAAGVRVLDDAYNANPDSMLAALRTLRELPGQGRRAAVLGDMAELGAWSAAAHSEVGRAAAQSGIDQLFAVGANAGLVAEAARRGGLRNVLEFADAEAAGAAVLDYAQPGDTILIKASRVMRLERISQQLLKGASRFRVGELQCFII
jgi:UDP-N-acetylmuramoyl-tripeptide--D-alanyl-D-alanine ligase